MRVRFWVAAFLLVPLLTATAGPAEARAAEPKPFKGAAAPWLWARSGLETVSATGPNDVWAAGYQGYQGVDWSIPGFGAGTIHVLPPKAMVVRWNGSTWQTYDMPGTEGDAVIQQIEAQSPTNVWAVGTIRPNDSTGSKPYLAHWDGSAWRQVQRPDDGCWPSKVAPDSTGAWFPCWTGLYRWENGSWTEHDAGTPPGACCVTIGQISVVSDDSAWAASTWGILHWDGQRWTKVHDLDDSYWHTVLAVSDTDVWVTGRQSTGGNVNRNVTLRWNGSTWQEGPATPANERLIRTGDGTMWALQPFWGELYRLDGDTWTRVYPPVNGGRLTGGTAVPGTPSMWLVGKTKNVPVVINNS
ncbi:hypothetical protein [Spirillospora sp. NPDC047279]|uniref:hypothetical protein n=1 Tax=Spirillospora sp. NPDC047279 TaxID=3155478 RepID=UPI0033F4544D